VYRIIIKVLFIKILIEQVKEQRNFIWSLKRLEECIWRYASEAVRLKKRVWRKSSWRHVIRNKVIRSKVIRSISPEATSPELTKYNVRSVQLLTLGTPLQPPSLQLVSTSDKNNTNIAADLVPFQMEWIWNWFFIGQLSNQAKDQWWRIKASSKTSWCNG